jgi:hypothetical protein
MITPEENRVLSYLRRHAGAEASEVTRACLPGVAPGLIARIISNLDWLGYLTVFYDDHGEPAFLQATSRGALAGHE